MVHSATDKDSASALRPVFTVTEAADYLRISRAGIYRLFESGRLKPARIGRRTLVRRIDADALLEQVVAGAG